MILLDTDHVTLYHWGMAEGERIRNRLDLLGLGDRPATTVITYEEQVRGWMKELAAAKKVTDEMALYARLNNQLKSFGKLLVVDFTEKAATEFQRLRALKVRIGTMDLKIAAIALANDATVWSRNLVDFRKVPGLKVEDVAG